jgi:tyrosine-protein phosphatase YwqE
MDKKETDKQVADLLEKVKALEADKAAQAKIIAELEVRLEVKVDEAKVNRPVVTIDKKKYAVLGAANVNGTKYSKEQIAQDAALHKALLDSGSGIIVPLEVLEAKKAKK